MSINTFTNNDGKLIKYYDKKVLVTYGSDDLKNMKISFEVKNEKSQKTGNNFCNIKKIKNMG